SLAEKENILVGPSSGSVMASMLDYIDTYDEGVFVGIFADDGRKFQSLYLQQNLFSEEEYRKYLTSCNFLPPLSYQL
ncbi:MAG TPA: cysteine synthase family protein, partial [Candidatus Nitrosocosmicus sp.]